MGQDSTRRKEKRKCQETNSSPRSNNSKRGKQFSKRRKPKPMRFATVSRRRCSKRTQRSLQSAHTSSDGRRCSPIASTVPHSRKSTQISTRPSPSRSQASDFPLRKRKALFRSRQAKRKRAYPQSRERGHEYYNMPSPKNQEQKERK